MMTDTTIADLRNQITEVQNKRLVLEAERDELAFAAHVERNAKAVQRLAEISTELDHLGNEKATIEAAIAEAGRRAVAASAAEAADAERKRAEKAQPIAERLAGLGAKADTAAKEYASCLVQIEAAIDDLAKLGAPVPSRSLVAVHKTLAHDSAMMGATDKTRVVPPGARRTFQFLTLGWSTPARNWIATKLSNTAAKTAA
jgi:chromosome segregation ATPase